MNTISIILKKNDFQPGEQVDGLINVNCQGMGGVVMLEILGTQAVKFKWTQITYYYATVTSGVGGNRRTRRVRRSRITLVPAEGNRVVIQQSTNLGQVSQGQFSIPFSFALPLDLPNSFKYYQTPEINATTRYQFRAIGPGSQDLVEFFVIKKIDAARAVESGQTLETSTKLECCGCFDKGNVKLRGQFEKSMYSNGDQVNIKTQIEKTSKATLNASGHATCTLVLTNGQRAQTINLSCGQFMMGNTPEGQDKVESQCSFQLQIPGGDLMPTSDTGFIKAAYSLTFQAKPDIYCSTGNFPSVSTLIQVGPKHQIYQPTFVPPPNWAPRINPATNFTVDIVPYQPPAHDGMKTEEDEDNPMAKPGMVPGMPQVGYNQAMPGQGQFNQIPMAQPGAPMGMIGAGQNQQNMMMNPMMPAQMTGQMGNPNIMYGPGPNGRVVGGQINLPNNQMQQPPGFDNTNF